MMIPVPLRTPRSAGLTAALLLLLGPATAATESTVTAVTVFPDRALVERTAAVDLPAGETRVVLSGLPANLWDHSLQVRGTGPDGTRILDVQSRNVFVESTPTPEIKQLEDQLESLQTDHQVLQDEHDALQRERGVLERIVQAATTPATEGDAARPSFDEWSELMRFSAEQTRRLADARRDVTDRIEHLDARITAVQNQLNEARGRLPGRRAVKEVTVRLVAATAGNGNVMLSYTVPGARWTPVYRARLDSTTRRVAFDYEAEVINRTGEPWTAVDLTLSTARPSAGGSAPEPQPWIVREQEVEVATSQFLESVRKAEASNGLMMRSPAPAADMVAEEATVQSGLTAATFHIAAPATIPADGTAQKVTVTTLDLPAGLRYDTTPKYIASAFLTATVTNDSDFPLLPGTLASFVDGAFIANSHLEQSMPGADFDLALGVDEAVEIERTLLDRFVEKTGFTNSGRRVTYEIKLTITNHKSIPVTLELAEPLPVSRHEKIEVELIEPRERDLASEDAPDRPFARDDEGILTWTGSLAAGAERELTLKFSIEHPADMTVTGVE